MKEEGIVTCLQLKVASKQISVQLTVSDPLLRTTKTLPKVSADQRVVGL